MQNYKSRDVIKILKNNGFQMDRQKGSHMVFKNGKVTVSVPCGNNEVSAPLWDRLKKEIGIYE